MSVEPDRLKQILKDYQEHRDPERLMEQLDSHRSARLRRSGNAYAVTVPIRWLRDLGWAEHDYVTLQLDKNKGTVTLEKAKTQDVQTEK
jgi:hypothetical protein